MRLIPRNTKVRTSFYKGCSMNLVKKMSKLCKKPLKSGIK